MTALQFKVYCGSNAADWRHVLKLVKPTGADGHRTRKKEKRTSVKTLIDQNKLPLHPPACLCPLCTENDFVQVSVCPKPMIANAGLWLTL